MSHNYGLTFDDLNACKRKLKKQEDFLENNHFTTSSGQEKSLLDVSYSANLSKRYYPRILNKVSTFVSHCIVNDMVPVFLTVTLDGFFRDLLKGDYTRYDKIKDDYVRHIPNNDRYGYYRDYLDKHSVLTPKDLYKILSHQLHNFFMSHQVKQIRKSGDDYAMLRVTEPHKDGVPHFHILIYLPEDHIPGVFKAFKAAFPAPRNHVRRPNATEIYPGSGLYDTHGFQTDVRSPVGYILKYILKSFRNLIDDKELDYLQAWYIQHRIPRLITTHTLMAQDIYSAVAPLDDDWTYLTDIKHAGGAFIDRDNGYFILDDNNGRQIIGEQGLIQIFNRGKLVRQYGEKKEKWIAPTKRKYNYKYYISRDFDDGTWIAFADRNLVEIFAGTDIPPDDYDPSIFSDRFILPSDCELIYEDPPAAKSIIRPDFFKDISGKQIEYKKDKSMSDFELYTFYINFDFDLHDPAKYAIAHNELIKRGLIDGKMVNPNDFNTEFEVADLG